MADTVFPDGGPVDICQLFQPRGVLLALRLPSQLGRTLPAYAADSKFGCASWEKSELFKDTQGRDLGCDAKVEIQSKRRRDSH